MMKVCVRQEKLLLEKNKRRCFLSYSMRMLVWFFFFFFLQKEMGWSNREGLVSRLKTEASSDLADFCCGQLLTCLHPQKEDRR